MKKQMKIKELNPNWGFKNSDILILIEPRYHGLKYIKAAQEIGIEVFAFYRVANFIEIPEGIEYAYIDVFNPNEIAQFIENDSFFKNRNIAILPGAEPFVPIAARVNQILQKKSILPTVADSAHDKSKMRTVFSNENVLCPQSRKYLSKKDILTDKNVFRYPLVVKPINLINSIHVKLVYNFEELLEAVDCILDYKEEEYKYPIVKGILIEEYIKGTEFSVEILLDKSKIWFASVTEKIKDELPFFVEIGHIVPASNITDEERVLLINAAYTALINIGVNTGPAHVEIMLSKNKPYIIELAARIGGGNIMDLVKLAYTVDIPLNVIKQSLGYDLSPVNPKIIQGASINFLYSKHRGQLLEIRGTEIVRKNKNIIELHIGKKEGDFISELKNSDNRIGHIIAVGNTNKDAFKNAQWAFNSIEILTQII